MPSAREIMDRSVQGPKPTSSVMTLSMRIMKNGQTLSRSLQMYASGDRDKGQTEKSLIKFLAPGDIKGAGFLSIRKADGSTESQLWLPALGRVRRLSSGSSDQDQPFFGSDFTNRDISGFSVGDFSYELTGQADSVYTIEAKPLKDLGYEKLVYHIEAGTYIQKSIDYWRAGKLVKSQVITWTKVKDYRLPSRIVMSASSGSSTELAFSDIKVDEALQDQTFTERFLKQ